MAIERQTAEQQEREREVTISTYTHTHTDVHVRGGQTNHGKQTRIERIERVLYLDKGEEHTMH